MLIDAINKITGTSDLYTSPIPEPFTYIPADMPAIAIADGSITSPFLTLFGRSARATGMENERNNKPCPPSGCTCSTPATSSASWSRGPKLKAIFDSGRKPAEIVEELYLTILSRFPTPDEVEDRRGVWQASAAHARSQRQADATSRKGADWIDVAWALDQQHRVPLPALIVDSWIGTCSDDRKATDRT